jgi:hypothetical protein
VKVDKDILDIVLMDDTGPVLTALWGDCVSSFFSLKQRHDGTGRILVHLSPVTITKLKKDDWNGECLSNIRGLSTVESRGGSLATQIVFPKEFLSPFIGQMQFPLPGPEACISTFLGVKTKFAAPFRGTFLGTVCDVQDTVQSHRGNPKKLFNLVDSSGYWFACCGLGRNAISKALFNGSKIIVFYGTGRASMGESAGAVYLLEDSVLLQIGRADGLVVKRVQLEIS